MRTSSRIWSTRSVSSRLPTALRASVGSNRVAGVGAQPVRQRPHVVVHGDPQFLQQPVDLRLGRAFRQRLEEPLLQIAHPALREGERSFLDGQRGVPHQRYRGPARRFGFAGVAQPFRARHQREVDAGVFQIGRRVARQLLQHGGRLLAERRIPDEELALLGDPPGRRVHEEPLRQPETVFWAAAGLADGVLGGQDEAHVHAGPGVRHEIEERRRPRLAHAGPGDRDVQLQRFAAGVPDPADGGPDGRKPVVVPRQNVEAKAGPQRFGGLLGQDDGRVRVGDHLDGPSRDLQAAPLDGEAVASGENVNDPVAFRSRRFEGRGFSVDGENGGFGTAARLGRELAAFGNLDRNAGLALLRGVEPQRRNAGVGRGRDPQRQFTGRARRRRAGEVRRQRRREPAGRLGPSGDRPARQRQDRDGAQREPVVERDAGPGKADADGADALGHAPAVRLEQRPAAGVPRVAGVSVLDGQKRPVLEPALQLQTPQRGLLAGPCETAQIAPQKRGNGDDEQGERRDVRRPGQPGPQPQQRQAGEQGQDGSAAPQPGQRVFPEERRAGEEDAPRQRGRAPSVSRRPGRHAGSIGPASSAGRHGASAAELHRGRLSSAIASSWLGLRRTTAVSPPRTSTSGASRRPL